MILLPGALLWGCHDEVKHGQPIPYEAIDKWEDEMGWRNQQHHLRVEFYRTPPEGLKLQVELAERIVNGGGFIHLLPWTTPSNLATVGTNWKQDGRLVYQKYPPSDFEAWSKVWLENISAFLKNISPEKIKLNCWHEPNKHGWRGSDKQFFELYAVWQEIVQDFQQKKGIKLQIGGVQMADLLDHHRGPGWPYYTQTPTMVWFERFLTLAVEKGWQIDFWDLFQYWKDVPTIIELIQDVENMMIDFGVEAELVFDCISPMQWEDPMDPEEDARYTIRLAKALHSQTTVESGGFDFLESGRPDWQKVQATNGLLEYGTLKELPRWFAAKKILEHG